MFEQSQHILNICVVGPTASGKTNLAQELALLLHGEVLSADSMQIYKGMDIGTGKLPEKSKYKYFLKGSITMNENHTPSGKFTEAGQIFTYPILSEQDYE